MTDRIRLAGQVAWAVVGLAALLALLGLAAWWLRVIWPPLILAGAIVFLLNPVVTTLQRRRVPRVVGTLLSYLAFFAVISLAGMAMVPLALDQADELADEWPEVREDIETWVNDLHDRTEDWIVTVPSVGEIESEVEGGGGDTIGETLDRVRDIGGRIFHIVLIIVLAPIVAFYLLVDLPRLRQVAESLVPVSARPEVLHVARRLNRAVGGFFRGQLLVAIIVGLMVSIGLAVIDLPFWLLIGMIAGGFNIIPLIGPWVGAVPGVVIALTTRDMSTAIWVAAIMAGAQQIDNHFISPLVMQRAVKLHPAAVMLALLAGGTIAGFLGLLLAVPTAAVLKILIGHIWRTHVLGEPFDVVVAGEEADDASAGVGFVRDVVDTGVAAGQPPPSDEAGAGGDQPAGTETEPVR